MCFWIQNGKEQIQTSKEDIIVYKRLEPIKKFYNLITVDFRSPYQNFSYKPKVLPTKLTLPTKESYNIEIGYHAYTNINQAFSNKYKNEEVYEFVIPAGTGYYINDHESEIVSEIMYMKSRKPVKLKQV